MLIPLKLSEIVCNYSQLYIGLFFSDAIISKTLCKYILFIAFAACYACLNWITDISGRYAKKVMRTNGGKNEF